MIKKVTMGLAFAAGVSCLDLAAAMSLEEKVALQATMFQHIESTLIDGVVPHVQLSDGTVVDLVPTKAHPMILTFGDRYVLCTDYRDPDGQFVNIDFYLTRRNGEFVVFQTEINNRAALEQLMKAGKVTMVK